MAALIITIFVIIVSLFFTAFFWGQYRVYKKIPGIARKHINPESNTFSLDTFKAEAKIKQDLFGAPFAFLAYVAFFGILLLCGCFDEWKNKFLSDFEQGNYVKAVSTTTYTVPSDTLKYHKTNNTYFIKKDKFEKMERKGEVEKE